MKQELGDLELESVSGGKYFLNGNTKKLCFSTDNTIFKLTDNTSVYAAMEYMDSQIGRFETQAEYDAHCIDYLQQHGMVTVIGRKS